MSEGISIVLSPVQLAAVLSDGTLSEAETLTNRILGGVGILFGGIELAGATALCLVPEPTGFTKAGCVVVGAHSLDTINSAADQMLTGQDVRTATHKLAVEMAKNFGADSNTAVNVGMTIDIAVPLGFGLAIGASRIAYVRAGNFKLIEHEGMKGVKAGGHTIAKHVAVPEQELLARLQRSPDMISASSFHSLYGAELFVSKTLKANRLRIIHWANTNNPHNMLKLEFNAGRSVGYGFKQGNPKKLTSNTVRVILLKKVYQGKPYFVLTAYPVMEYSL
ncbi:hypothetical protein HC231_02670 [Brenneria izadpanahii]|uniref:Bacterial CdiA-CT RNAse A domain-containing protein n=1 Tax=Brenneria izadpanahii TaxID=2722756 RepID=A0ABX7UMY5_9GAMM|nr:RNase A-like domain-containing protein [Brenneria izadpanahii]QTF06959.1 hypothetical protein HC231_02670 [Brenneria izadpanahii]